MTPALAAAFAGEVTAIALCWKLTRADGVVLGFTGHDSDIRRDGVDYRARPGMTPSAVRLGSDFSADSMDVEGVLDAETISADDLDLGRWTGAQVEMFACDWTLPDAGMLRLMRGTIGDVVRRMVGSEGSFRAELVSDMARLQRAGAPRCSPLCRAELGDGRCGVAMDGRTIEVDALGGAGEMVHVAFAISSPEAFRHGRLRVMSGPLAGLDRRIADVRGSDLELEEPIWGNGLTGARVRLWEGCDKRFETCATRFGNGLVFDGEPHVPGTDALFRYGDA